jgi:hypothetical protein
VAAAGGSDYALGSASSSQRDDDARAGQTAPHPRPRRVLVTFGEPSSPIERERERGGGGGVTAGAEALAAVEAGTGAEALAAVEAGTGAEAAIEAAIETAIETDPLIYDRFGPAFSAPEFRWHRDAQPGDGRLVSLVLYLSPSDAYVGGELQIRPSPSPSPGPAPGRGASRAPRGGGDDGDGDGDGGGDAARRPPALHRYRFEPGDVIAFPSCDLEHCVTPVTYGERRSVLLLVGRRP